MYTSGRRSEPFELTRRGWPGSAMSARDPSNLFTGDNKGYRATLVRRRDMNPGVQSSSLNGHWLSSFQRRYASELQSVAAAVITVPNNQHFRDYGDEDDEPPLDYTDALDAAVASEDVEEVAGLLLRHGHDPMEVIARLRALGLPAENWSGYRGGPAVP
jgi:hypothetical protein